MEVGGEGRPEDRGRFEGVFIDLSPWMADLVSSRQKSSKVGDFQHKLPFMDAAPISACWSESKRKVALHYIVVKAKHGEISLCAEPLLWLNSRRAFILLASHVYQYLCMLGSQAYLLPKW